MEIFRCLAIFPLVASSWLATLMIGLFVLDFSVLNFCPSEMREGSVCYVSWWNNVEESIIVLFASISAIVAIVTGYLTAPFNKAYFAKLIYLLGVTLAFIIAYSVDHYWLAFTCCVIIGFITVCGLLKQVNNKIK